MSDTKIDYVLTLNTGEKVTLDLLPCPFCGKGPPEVTHIGNYEQLRRLIRVECSRCGVRQQTGARRLNDNWLVKAAVKRWNQRNGVNL